MPPQSATATSATEQPYDLALVGGGLQNGLIALACLQRRPDLSIALIEREPQLGGNHTWAIHPFDVPAEARGLVEPLIVHSWDGYDVRFPDCARTLRGGYSATTSQRFAQVVKGAFDRSARARLLLGERALTIARDHVELASGRRLRASLIVDARGPGQHRAASGQGFQKFLGLELELDREHGLARPILIDAEVPQSDGFRFFYVLPLSPTRLLVEDTVFSPSAVLDLERCRREVTRYAQRFGGIAQVVREETGVLPMPWQAQPGHGPAPSPRAPLQAGYQGGWFHPATGYSFPVALRLACHIADHIEAGSARDALGPDLARLAREHGQQARYAYRLNHMLFNWFPPQEMWNVFARFYTLPEAVIHRFYALSLTRLDRARIVVGKPPRGLSLHHVLTRSR